MAATPSQRGDDRRERNPHQPLWCQPNGVLRIGRDAAEDGFRLVGTHRRIKIADLMAYRQADDAEHPAALEELAAEGQKDGLGY